MSSITGYNPATVPTLTSGTYRHVALSISGTVHTLYLDGSMVAQNLSGGNVFASYTSAIQNVFIGCASDLSYGLTGSIDDFKIWNRVLPPTDISAIYYANPPIIPFTPNLISGLTLWLDAADTTQFTLQNTNQVSTWRDKSGVGNNAVVNTLSNTIILSTFPSTTYPCVFFNGANSLKMNMAANIFPCTFFAVFNMPCLNANYSGLLTEFPPFAAGSSQLQIYNGPSGSTTNTVITISKSGGGGLVINSTAFNSVNKLSLLTFQLTSPTTCVVNINGSSSGPITYSGGYPNGSSSNINACINGGAGMYLCEEVWYQGVDGALNSYRYQQVEGYLAWKWGIQGNLPAIHPYKTAAPSTPVEFVPVSFFKLASNTTDTGSNPGSYITGTPTYSAYSGITAIISSNFFSSSFGAGSRITINPLLSVSTGFSISFWTLTTATNNVNFLLVNSSNVILYAIEFNNPAAAIINYNTYWVPTTNKVTYSGIPGSVNIWYHYVMCFTNTSFTMYVNPISSFSSTPLTGTITGTLSSFLFSASNNYIAFDRATGGQALRNVGFYNSILSPTQVNTIWSSGLSAN